MQCACAPRRTASGPRSPAPAAWLMPHAAYQQARAAAIAEHRHRASSTHRARGAARRGAGDGCLLSRHCPKGIGRCGRKGFFSIGEGVLTDGRIRNPTPSTLKGFLTDERIPAAVEPVPACVGPAGSRREGSRAGTQPLSVRRREKRMCTQGVKRPARVAAQTRGGHAYVPRAACHAAARRHQFGRMLQHHSGASHACLNLAGSAPDQRFACQCIAGRRTLQWPTRSPCA